MAQMPPAGAVGVAGPGGVGRRALIGGGGLAGLAGLGGALGVGFWLSRRSPAISGERVKVAHLLRRAGFAPTAAELDAAARAGLGPTIDTLLHPERADDSALEKRLAGDAFD